MLLSAGYNMAAAATTIQLKIRQDNFATKTFQLPSTTMFGALFSAYAQVCSSFTIIKPVSYTAVITA
jgi:hypothetical protein